MIGCGDGATQGPKNLTHLAKAYFASPSFGVHHPALATRPWPEYATA